MSKKSTVTFPEFSADSFKAGFEQAREFFGQAETAAKDNVEASIEAAMIAGQGLQTLGNESYAYARQSAEDAIAATKTLFGAKSLMEAFQIQADFAKAAYFGSLRQAARVNEVLTSTTRDSFAPLQGRIDSLTRTGGQA